MSTTNTTGGGFGSTVKFVPYQDVPETTYMRSVPRFSHSSDFSDLFSSNQQEVSDYAQGLLFIGCFLLTVFVIWFIILLVLKCTPGAGFLAGHRFTNRTRATHVRIVFTLAAVLSMLFTILLVTEGITNLQDTLTTVDNSNQEISGIVSSAERIASSLQVVGDSSKSIRTTLIDNLGNLCPSTDALQSEIGIDLEAQAQTAIDLLQQLNDFVSGDLQSLQKGIATAKALTEDIDTATTNIAIYDWQSLLILIPWILVPSFMLVGVLMATCYVSNEVFECILSWFLTPLLIVMTIFSIGLASAVSLAAVGNADFCSGGTTKTPNESVDAILINQGYSTSDVLYQAIKFYTNQCTDASGNPFYFIEGYAEQIASADVQVATLDASINTIGLDRLELLCGENIREIAALTGQMSTNLGILKNSSEETIQLLSCDNLVPVYTSTVYDGTCNYSIKGVTWTFAAFLVVGFMGTLMIMLRSSFLAVEELEDDESNYKDDRDVDDDDYDEGVERSYTGHIRDTDPDDGSFASGFRSDDDDVYTSTGYDDDEDRYRFEQEYARNQSRATAPPDTSF